MEPLIYVLDASAVIRYFENEAGASRVEELLNACMDSQIHIEIPAVNWGEVYTGCIRLFGIEAIARVEFLRDSVPLEIVEATAERAKRAALIRYRHGIGYADCFGVELAGDSASHILVTGDYGVKKAENEVRLEFLPTKSKP